MNASRSLRAYDSIAHLPGSRMTTGDHRASADVAAACLDIDSPNTVVVQEKLDGSCVAAWRDGDELVATARSGRPAAESEMVQHRLFSLWVGSERERFLDVLRPGERLVGEWLALAHGTRYSLSHEPFVAFDLFSGDERLGVDAFTGRLGSNFITPRLVFRGAPQPLEVVIGLLEPSGHGALDSVEGAVWRVEQAGETAAVAKWVRPNKVDGAFLPTDELAPHWNWHPQEEWMWAAAGGYSGRG